MKKVLALILVLVMLIAVSGCGLLNKAKDFKDGLDDVGDLIDDIEDDLGDDIGDDFDDDDDDDDDYVDDDDDDDDYVDDDADDPLLKADVYYPEDCNAMFDRFQEFGYIWTTTDADGNSSQWSSYYISEGTEEVDGVTAEVISYTHSENGDTEYKFWFDEGWEFIKGTVDGEENNDWGAAALTMAVQNYVNYVTLTQTVIDTDGILESFTYTLEDQRSESSDVGDMEVYELSSNFSATNITYGLTQVGEDLTFVLINQAVNDSQQSEELLVTHAVPR